MELCEYNVVSVDSQSFYQLLLSGFSNSSNGNKIAYII